jgi:[ribosomal protein S18]-alanine N-acetyltransferase
MAVRALPEVPDPEDVHVRISPMRRRHLRAVMRIEAQVYPRPWTTSLFAGEIAQRDSRCYVVARVGSTLVGYAGQLYSFEDAHVTNIAVDPVWHRHQVGTRLLITLMRQAVARSCRNLTLEVRVSNTGAQAMYRRFGFAPAGMRRKYYENVEDAIVMWCHDIGSAEHQARLLTLERDIAGTTTWEALR